MISVIVSRGFDIDKQWKPGKGKAVFVAAKKRD